MLKASKHEAPLKIRSPYRAVRDDDVDRPQVQVWQHTQPSGTNSPTPFGVIPQRKDKTAANDAAAAMPTGLPRAERQRSDSGAPSATIETRSTTRQTTERRPSGRVLFHLTKVVIAQGLHLFPSRTEKLNLAAPMILRKWESRSPPPLEPRGTKPRGFFFARPRRNNF